MSVNWLCMVVGMIFNGYLLAVYDYRLRDEPLITRVSSAVLFWLCTSMLWVLVMMRPPIQQLKSTGIPKGLLSLMTNQDPKVRWTAAELLLHIRVTEASIESPEPDAHLHLAEEEQSLAQALQEQLVQSVQQIQTEVTAKKGEVESRALERRVAQRTAVWDSGRGDLRPS